MTKLKKYYSDLVDVENKMLNQVCLYGQEICKTYEYRKFELTADILRLKIELLECFCHD